MKKLFLVLMLSSFFSLHAASIMAADSIGRLFTTPAERSNLDYLRQTQKKLVVPIKIDSTESVESAPVELPDAVNLQGYVKRNDGKQGTVWLNDQAMQENTGNKDVQVGRLPQNGNRVPIKLPANGKSLTLKAGQVYNPENNRVSEARNHGAEGANDDSGKLDGTIDDNF
jgi:hypothetical protein